MGPEVPRPDVFGKFLSDGIGQITQIARTMNQSQGVSEGRAIAIQKFLPENSIINILLEINLRL